MSTSLQFNIALPDVENPYGHAADWRFAPIIMCLETLTKINQWHFRRGAAITLAEANVRYQEEPPGREDWDDCITVANRGWGDCEDLAAYLAAEFRERHGIHAECVIYHQFISADEMRSNNYPEEYIPHDGVFLIHVLVRLPNGMVLDPSKWLGMEGDFS